jgi:hypothetical protein
MGLFDWIVKSKTEKGTSRVWSGKTGTYIKSSGVGRGGLTEFYFPKKKKR